MKPINLHSCPDFVPKENPNRSFHGHSQSWASPCHSLQPLAVAPARVSFLCALHRCFPHQAPAEGCWVCHMISSYRGGERRCCEAQMKHTVTGFQTMQGRGRVPDSAGEGRGSRQCREGAGFQRVQGRGGVPDSAGEGWGSRQCREGPWLISLAFSRPFLTPLH